MPLFNYRCADCGKGREHFVPSLEILLTCPACGSARYNRRTGRFSVNMEYSDNSEYMEKKIDPFVNEIYEKIGKEATNEDTKTLENIYGTDTINNSIAKDHD
jgi:putative FmdB family regulatory protein